MPRTTALSADHPVSRAIAHSDFATNRLPIPLVSTSYDIRISGGLADIVETRTFRNSEAHSVEALLAFPLPVHAVLYAMLARIGDRMVVANARAKSDARAVYEAAIDQGKTAVLHEELIRGIHLLSVGHIAPGTEIAVTARLALSLSAVGSRVFLRLPTTVGDVYGSSGLPDSDDLVHGGGALMADVTVVCDSGDASLSGGGLINGKGRAALDAPIVLDIKGWTPRKLVGCAADGRAVSLQIAPASGGKGAIDAAILVDRSGSMGELCAADACLSKHAAVLLGLSEAAEEFSKADRLDLWEFDDDVREIGKADDSTWRSLIRKLDGPGGGTQIGLALKTVQKRSSARDILLLTDGKSYALDVQKLAGMGRRVTVVLIGEDSLEANVAHLAALTNGDILVPDGANVTGAVRDALKAIRLSGDPRESKLRRCGMAIEARWSAGEAQPASDQSDAQMLRAVAAFAASLLLPSLNMSEATALAVAEGLVTHLTSLVLVDEAGVAQSGLPMTRKVALPSPRTSSAASAPYRAASRSYSAADIQANFSHGSRRNVVVQERRERREPAPLSLAAAMEEEAADILQDRTSAPPRRSKPAPTRVSFDLSAIGARIDWTNFAPQLTAGELTGLEKGIADAIRRASELALVRKAARRLGIEPLILVVALIARSMAKRDRHADRVARSVLGALKPRQLAHAAERLGLQT